MWQLQLARRGQISAVLRFANNSCDPLVSAWYAAPASRFPWLVSYEHKRALADELAAVATLLNIDLSIPKLLCLHQQGEQAARGTGVIIISVRPTDAEQSARIYAQLTNSLLRGHVSAGVGIKVGFVCSRPH